MSFEKTTVGNYWQERQQELEQHLATGNFNEFFKWGEVAITMYVGHFPFVDVEYQALREKRPGWLELINEPGNHLDYRQLPDFYEDNTPVNERMSE